MADGGWSIEFVEETASTAIRPSEVDPSAASHLRAPDGVAFPLPSHPPIHEGRRLYAVARPPVDKARHH